jgi:hypothetical protein
MFTARDAPNDLTDPSHGLTSQDAIMICAFFRKRWRVAWKLSTKATKHPEREPRALRVVLSAPETSPAAPLFVGHQRTWKDPLVDDGGFDSQDSKYGV